MDDKIKKCWFFKEMNMIKNLKFGKIVFFILVAITAAGLMAASFSGWGYKALDGDSITVAMENEKVISVELAGIDCPELEQDFGKEAMDFSKAFIYKKKLLVEISSYDTEGHVVARVSLDGQDLSLALLEAGLAWYDKKNSSDKQLAKAQKKAKKAKTGLWSNPKPTPPWIFRSVEENKEKSTQ
jgi:micrococcal nuclease